MKREKEQYQQQSIKLTAKVEQLQEVLKLLSHQMSQSASEDGYSSRRKHYQSSTATAIEEATDFCDSYEVMDQLKGNEMLTNR